MSAGRGTPSAHTASAGKLNIRTVVTFLEKVPCMDPSAMHSVAGFFRDNVTGSDRQRRLLNFAYALRRNEKLVKRAEDAYFQTLDGKYDAMLALVRMSTNDLATPERQRERVANKNKEPKKFSEDFRPVMDDRAKLEQQARSVWKSRVGSVSNLEK
jgi:hypothetical protein